MSDYLVRELDSLPNVDVQFDTELVACRGDATLAGATVRDRGTGDEHEVDADAVFVLIGSQPRTDWLPADVVLDEWGFIVTGQSSQRSYETSMPGVFAVGDVRRGSLKRVATAVGDGAAAVSEIHDYLAATAKPAG